MLYIWLHFILSFKQVTGYFLNCSSFLVPVYNLCDLCILTFIVESQLIMRLVSILSDSYTVKVIWYIFYSFNHWKNSSDFISITIFLSFCVFCFSFFLPLSYKWFSWWLSCHFPQGATPQEKAISVSFLRCFSFSKMIFFYLNVFTFNWRIIALQYYIDFCHMSTWISHKHMYVPFPLNLPPTPSHLFMS